MTVDLHNRSYLNVVDFTPEELTYLLDLAAQLKEAKRRGREVMALRGKNIALIFEKTSTRTRCAFEVAAYDQGAHVTYLGPDGSQIGHKESIKDTARVLGRMYDAIEYRGYGQEIVEELATHAGVPVYNGLTDDFHPTQMLADILTMREHASEPLNRISYCYLGDARFNTGNSLMFMGSKLGMDVRLCAPDGLWPDRALIDRARRIAGETGARLLVTSDVDEAVKGVDFLCTDVWVSMGEDKAVWEERIKLLMPYQVNSDVIRRTGNPDVKVMHCLPAFHDRNTRVGEDIYRRFGLDALEITDEVFESPRSIVFDEAENRVHTIKAVMVATIGTGADRPASQPAARVPVGAAGGGT
jgi:ornithine carbamoyltransferase